MLQNQLNGRNETLERYKERLTNFSGEFELGLFLFIIKKSLPWIFLFFAASVGVSWLYLRYSQPEYESSTVIKINSDNSASKINLENIYNVSDDQDELAGAVEIIRSKGFLKRVLSKLPLEVSYFAEGNIKTNEHYKSSPYIVSVNKKVSDIAGTRFDIKFNPQYNGGTISYLYGGKNFSKTFTQNSWIDFAEVSLLVTIDQPKLKAMLTSNGDNAFYFVVNDIEDLADNYFSRLNVAIVNEAAKTIAISFTDNNAVKAYDVVNTIAQEYNSYDIEQRSASGLKTLEFINGQLATDSVELIRAQEAIHLFRDTNDLRDDEAMNKLNTELFGSLEEQLTKIDLEKAAMTEIQEKLQDKNVDVKSLLSLLSGTENGQALQTGMTSLAGLVSQRAISLQYATPASEEIKSLNYQIDVQKDLLISSVGSILSQLNLREKALEEKRKEYGAKLPLVNNLNVEYTRLQHIYDIQEEFYTLLIKKKYEYLISEAGYTPQYVILESARIPQAPISPNKKTTLITFILIAFVVSLAMVIIRYLMHDKINSLNEITKQTNASVSVLGIIPKYKQNVPVSQLLVDKNPKSLIAESFRSLRTNLQFISNEPGPKIMAVTSTISGEGKTFVAINLAGIIAYSGKKVIILDLDMRKPKIHLGFNATNEKGMSTLLIGKDKLEDCIKQSTLENLDFITAGPIPPNPSELIISQAMNEIIDSLKKTYELIIIDNPPIGLVTDGIHTFQMADYPVYIFRADYSKRNFIQIVDKMFNENNIKKLAVILNGVDVERKGFGYNYGYGYGYGSGYGYGYYDDQHRKKNFLDRLVGKK